MPLPSRLIERFSFGGPTIARPEIEFDFRSIIADQVPTEKPICPNQDRHLDISCGDVRLGTGIDFCVYVDDSP